MSDGVSHAMRDLEEDKKKEALEVHMVKQVDDVMQHGVSFYGESRSGPPHGGAKIKGLIAQLQELARKFGDDAILRLEEAEYDYSEITIEYLRPEKNIERIRREKAEAIAADMEAKKTEKLKAKELKEYKRLKAKYGG